MMRWFYVARTGFRSLFARRVFDEQLDADLEFHLEQATAEYIRDGLSPDQARRAALKAFGNPVDVREDVRETSMWIWWERLAQDVRYSLRGFRRSPAFTATAVLSLALGIGASTAIFSIFNTLVLRPLPVRDPPTLFQVLHRGDAGASESSTYALYEHLKNHAKTPDRHRAHVNHRSHASGDAHQPGGDAPVAVVSRRRSSQAAGPAKHKPLPSGSRTMKSRPPHAWFWSFWSNIAPAVTYSA